MNRREFIKSAATKEIRSYESIKLSVPCGTYRDHSGRIYKDVQHRFPEITIKEFEDGYRVVDINDDDHFVPNVSSYTKMTEILEKYSNNEKIVITTEYDDCWEQPLKGGNECRLSIVELQYKDFIQSIQFRGGRKSDWTFNYIGRYCIYLYANMTIPVNVMISMLNKITKELVPARYDILKRGGF